MKKYYWIIGIIAAIVVVAVILIGGVGPEEEGGKYIITENPAVINKDISSVPSSPMDIVLIISQFSEDKTSEITAKISKREGYPTRGVNWINTNAEIKLPEGLKLIGGKSTWQGDIIGDDVKEFKIKVEAVKNGEWIVEANAKYIIDENSWWGDVERFYILVKDEEVLISDKSFTPVSPGGKAEQIKEEYPVCPGGYEWEFCRNECVPLEHPTCPDNYKWDPCQQECVLKYDREHPICPGNFTWDEVSQSCKRGEEPVNP